MNLEYQTKKSCTALVSQEGKPRHVTVSKTIIQLDVARIRIACTTVEVTF